MAAKKKATRARRSASNGAPAGFRKVETHLSGFWKPEIVGQSIQGIVGDPIEGTTTDGKANIYHSFTITEAHGGPIINKDGKKIKDEIGMTVGVGGKVLLGFLGTHRGREVYLTYQGLGEKKPGQNAPKLYSTFERGED